jgi:hypothetical protein
MEEFQLKNTGRTNKPPGILKKINLKLNNKFLEVHIT